MKQHVKITSSVFAFIQLLSLVKPITSLVIQRTPAGLSSTVTCFKTFQKRLLVSAKAYVPRPQSRMGRNRLVQLFMLSFGSGFIVFKDAKVSLFSRVGLVAN